MNERDVRDQVQQLRDALEKAQGKILEQKEMLNQLTAPPFTYATVISVNTREDRDSREALPEVLKKKGTQVRIRRDSRFAYQNSGIGRVNGDREYGWVSVEFGNGYQNGYRIGLEDVENGACDLELAKATKTIGTATITLDGKFVEVLLPQELKVNPGDTVTVVMETMQIVDVAAVQIGGDIAYIRRVIDDTFSEVDYQSSVRVVFNGKFNKKIEKGDRVVLDGTATVIIRNLGKEDERFSFTTETNVSWNEIGGLDEAKREMIEAVELPHVNPDIFRFYGKKPIKGVLLYGPPGCGKTMLGKATATALARIYNGGSTSSGFIYIKGPEILDRFVGVAEATVRQIFQRARKHKEKHGYPAVVFIDEADAILSKRGSGISSDVERTIVPMFLTEMDGLEDSGALVILATNRSDILDPAIVRDGRIDRKIRISRPTPESAAEIFHLNLKRVPLNNGYTYEELAKLGSDEVFSSKRTLYQIKTKDGVREFTLGNILNGGMVVSIVDQATSIAMHRDLREKKEKPAGLCREDIVAAVDTVFRQNRDLNHTDELSEFVHDFREDVVGIQKLRQGTA
jgi:proteasome-associated ATPase